MRIDEFASAEEQMALWKLVNDNIWQAIETQRQQQAQAAQAKAAKAKLKPRKGRKGGRGKLSIRFSWRCKVSMNIRQVLVLKQLMVIRP